MKQPLRFLRLALAWAAWVLMLCGVLWWLERLGLMAWRG